jgi:hypothetical protein
MEGLLTSRPPRRNDKAMGEGCEAPAEAAGDDLPAAGAAEMRSRLPAACIQTSADLLWVDCAESFQPSAREIAMAKGQMRSNKEKKKPKADKNLKKGGVAPVNPFATGKTPSGQAPNSKKN